MKLKKYNLYKNSNVSWIDLIPIDWTISKLKWYASFQTGTTPATINEGFYSNDGFPWFRPEDIDDDNQNIKASKFLSEAGLSEVNTSRSGCTVVCGIGTIGKAAFATQVFATNQQLIAIDSKFDDKFFFYLIKASRNELESLSTGNVVRILNNERLGNLLVPILNKKEQAKISKFIDFEIEKLNILISKQERLIELLKEKRQAVVSHAVTKGLDADAQMKDTGLEWIKTVPVKWEIVTLKLVARIFSGGTPDKSKTEYWENGTIPWINSGEVNQFLITTPSTFITEEALNNSSAKWIPKNNLVIALAGQGKTKGMVAQLAIDTTCNQSMAAIVPNNKFDPRYLLWWLSSKYKDIRGLAGGDLRDGLNLEHIGSIKCPLPGLADQKLIVDFIDNQLIKIEQLISKSEKSIELAKEHRSALISAAVTGKIDVRDFNLDKSA